MSFINLFSGSKKYLVFDVGTESIKVGLFLKSKNGLKLSNVLNYDFKNSILLEGISSSVYFDGIKKAMSDFFDIIKKNKIKSDGFYATVPAFFSKYFIVDVNINRKDKNKPINKLEEQKIKKTIFNLSYENVLKNYGFPNEQYILSNYDILSYKILGYRVKDIFNKIGDKISAKVVMFFINKRFEDIFKEVGKTHKVSFVNEINPIKGIINISDRKSVFLDVGGLTTECFYFGDFGLEEVSVFNFGGYFLTKELSQKLGISYGSAKDLKEKYILGKVSSSVRERINSHFGSIVDIWVAELKDYFEKKNIVYFDNIFLYGGTAFVELFSDKIENKFGIKPKFLHPENVKGVVVEGDLEIKTDLRYTNLLLVSHSI